MMMRNVNANRRPKNSGRWEGRLQERDQSAFLNGITLQPDITQKGDNR